MRNGHFRVYHHGAHNWEDYLLNIQEAQNEARRAVIAASLGTNDDPRLHTDLLYRQFQLSSEIRDDIWEMKLEMQWGFSLVVDRMDQQIGLVSDIVEKLDAIYQTLRSPLITQANELWRLGEDRFKKGLYDRALDAFLQSEEKNEVLFPLQLRIGTLLLEGRNAECNVLNLPEAERHLLLAARFAIAERKTTPNSSEYAGKAYYRAAQAAYLMGVGSPEGLDSNMTRQCLSRALQYLAKTTELWPEFRGSLYLQAKCHSLLGGEREALESVGFLSDTDRTFYSAAMDDEDFSKIRQKVEDAFRRAIDKPGPNASRAEASLARARTALNWAKRSNPQSEQDKRSIAAYERELTSIKGQLGTLDVDIDLVMRRILSIRIQLQELAERLMRSEMNSLAEKVTSLNWSKAEAESKLSRLHTQKAQAQGSSALGCLAAAVMFALLVAAWSLLVLPTKSMSEILASPTSNLILLAGLAVCVIVSFNIGKALSRYSQTRPLQRQIDVAESELRDWHGSASTAIAESESEARALEAGLQEFFDWRAVGSLPSMQR